MIELKLDAPFDIGDEVWFKRREDSRTKLECPFCHGNPHYDTGMNKIKAPSMIKDDEIGKVELEFEPWIINCKTCGGTGYVSGYTGCDTKWYCGVIKNVAHLHPSGDWRDYQYIIEVTSDTSDLKYTVVESGHSIYLKPPKSNKPQMSEA